MRAAPVLIGSICGAVVGRALGEDGDDVAGDEGVVALDERVLVARRPRRRSILRRTNTTPT